MFLENKNVAMNAARIRKYISVFEQQYLPRLEKLKRYYDCKNDTVTNKIVKDVTKKNNRIAHSFGDYVCTISTNYFIGKAVTYNSNDTEMLTELTNIYKYNDEITCNNQLALNASIYGISEELIYMDENSNVRFKEIDPRSCILIFENTIEQNLLYAIRYYYSTDILTDKKTLNVELYSENDIKYYTGIEDNLTLTDTQEHYFNMPPVNYYFNNKDLYGDFEKIISLIDGYDEAQSMSADERDSFSEAYLVFKNTGLTTEDIIDMKRDRNIIIESDDFSTNDCGVDFLTKNINGQDTETNKQRLENDIHKFSFISNMSEQKSHTSSFGAQLGLLGLEMVMARKEALFRMGLTRRAEIILEILNLKGAKFDFRNLSMIFTKNITVDVNLTADTISKLKGTVSNETLMSLLPFVNDIEAEKAKLAKENELNSYANIFADGADEDEEQTL